ncbi:SOS response-associated peptidase [Fodinibius halophilus]|uniref:Abasic site processing protein n=1 Tax=Fodinibius halophilus TaxID=1736908 RepID=A0A6M1SUK1_9BACT|nr:SOS response-associated peptidase [Fodinibius halophilus]NGP87236.1 SOS response-associated peptidase [Fodinibius halophilus]
MSDRFVFQASKEEVKQLFHVTSERDDFFNSDFNITPGSLIPAICKEDGERKLYKFVWGLIPENAEEEKEGRGNYEAAIENLEENKLLIECLAQRRCLIPAKGFYKWKTTEKKSTPFFIRLLSNELTAIAGIYSVWKSSSGRDVYSCAMLTTSANALVQPVDDRMPVLLHPDDHKRWLADNEIKPGDLKQFLNSYLITDLAVNRVSEKVNDLDNNNADLIQPIPK